MKTPGQRMFAAAAAQDENQDENSHGGTIIGALGFAGFGLWAPGPKPVSPEP
jgi:hypothetical protein